MRWTEEMVLDCWCGGRRSQLAGDREAAILNYYEREWEACPCDPEGATPEQEAELDAILTKCAEELRTL